MLKTGSPGWRPLFFEINELMPGLITLEGHNGCSGGLSGTKSGKQRERRKGCQIISLSIPKPGRTEMTMKGPEMLRKS